MTTLSIQHYNDTGVYREILNTIGSSVHVYPQDTDQYLHESKL